MLIRHAPDIKPSEITDRRLYLNRRALIGGAASLGGLAALGFAARKAAAETFTTVKSPFSTDEPPTPKDKITSYNNFYEFGVEKDEPAENAGSLKIAPWSVAVEGECTKPATFAIEDIVKLDALEDRIYRHRCVEAWSMVIPWVGFPLASLLKKVEPTGNAKYVAFETLYAPEQMPGQRRPVLEWPYREGLRIDEAMHPLALLAVGLYGETLPNQDGAPIRLVVPWKYGFKSIKSIVRIRLQEERPRTAWNVSAPDEYGFYSNVNPEVDHPRWSQKRERRIGSSLFGEKRDTLMFNGYADQVASLYSGMDLRRNF